MPVDRWYEVIVSPIAGVTTPPAGGLMLVAFHDLTPLRRAEEMRADFVANASHELRTPLATLSGFIETLQGPARDDAAARERFLKIMQAQATRMARLIDDLLSLSRIELNAHLRPDREVDLVAIVRQVADGLQMLAQDRGVEVKVTAPAKPLLVQGDRDELLRVFENLVENALKYASSGKRVEIDVAIGEGSGARREARVAVRDYGPGIAPEHLPRLTERFYRVDVAESRAQGGTGLGLALVKHILNRHGGRLTIESAARAGSDLHLPSAARKTRRPPRNLRVCKDLECHFSVTKRSYKEDKRRLGVSAAAEHRIRFSAPVFRVSPAVRVVHSNANAKPSQGRHRAAGESPCAALRICPSLTGESMRFLQTLTTAGFLAAVAVAPVAAADISGAGATFPYPIYAKWADAYKKETGIGLNYQSIGSGGGIKQIQNKTVTFGASDAPLKGEQLEKIGLVQFPMVMGGIVPVVNLEGIKPGELTLDGPTLANIFMGKIKTWNDPAIQKLNPSAKLPAQPIVVVHRSDGSGTTFNFAYYLSEVSPEWKSKVSYNTSVEWPVGIGAKGNEGVANNVAQTKGSIGYVEYAYAHAEQADAHQDDQQGRQDRRSDVRQLPGRGRQCQLGIGPRLWRDPRQPAGRTSRGR